MKTIEELNTLIEESRLLVGLVEEPTRINTGIWEQIHIDNKRAYSALTSEILEAFLKDLTIK